MSTKSDFKMFSEAYDSIYLEADLLGDESTDSITSSGNPTGQFSSAPPTANQDLPASTGNPKLDAANMAFQNLQSSLSQLPHVDPTIAQHLKGIATILQNHASSSSQPVIA